MTETIKLPTTFIGTGEVKDFKFTQVFENEKGYVYEVNTGSNIHYESFLKKERPICLDFEKRIYSETDKKEVYPKSNDFGATAWTTKKMSDAILKIIIQ